MSILGFFHKLKVGLDRSMAPSFPYQSQKKRYGSRGEDSLVYLLCRYLPECKVKQNVLVSSAEGDAEIDCLVLYKNKLFAVEVKRWRGFLVEEEDRFVQKKPGRHMRDIRITYHKSPKKQLSRAIYLLCRAVEGRAWINGCVFFADQNRESVLIRSRDVYFADIGDLVDNIMHSGQESYGSEAEAFFERCICADKVYSTGYGSEMCGIIPEGYLSFNTDEGPVCKGDIARITVEHHFFYDRLNIYKRDGTSAHAVLENAVIGMTDGGYTRFCHLCRIDGIFVGRELHS